MSCARRPPMILDLWLNGDRNAKIIDTRGYLGL